MEGLRWRFDMYRLPLSGWACEGDILMINFDEELKKYKPSLEVDQAEEAIQRNDLRDVVEIVEEMLQEFRNDPKRFKQFSEVRQ